MPQESVADWDVVDWETLRRLRAGFLDGTAGQADYWTSDAALASYDHTFGQRIAWKWRHVLRELNRLGWAPPAGPVLDWGCGTGVAGRAFLEAFPPDARTTLALHDRSARACEFARRQVQAAFPGLGVRADSNGPFATLLVSHVLTELSTATVESVLQLAAEATAVIWIEPGTHAVSRRLIALRERLRPGFQLVAPCTHQGPCGLLADGNASHWCHHFAAPPPEVFTNSGWARFGKLAGVDLRSLPLSYLVLDRRPVPPLPDRAVRLIGRPRVYKAHALVFGCDAAGVAECELQRRSLPEAFRAARKDRLDTLQTWICLDGKVRDLQPLALKPGGSGTAAGVSST